MAASNPPKDDPFPGSSSLIDMKAGLAAEAKKDPGWVEDFFPSLISEMIGEIDKDTMQNMPPPGNGPPASSGGGNGEGSGSSSAVLMVVGGLAAVGLVVYLATRKKRD